MSLVIPQKVNIKISSTNWKHFKELGYEIPMKIGYGNKLVADRGKEIEVNALDLPYRTEYLVKVECDYCGKTTYLKYRDVYRQLHSNVCNKICCTNENCKREKAQYIRIQNADNKSPNRDTSYRDKDWLYNQYIIIDKSAEQISEETGLGLRTLREYIHNFGLTTKNGRKTKCITKEELYDLYVVNKYTTQEIGIKFNLGNTTIGALLRKYNIPIFSQSERMKYYYYQKGGLKKAIKIANKMENRIRSSCITRGINISDFDGFVTSENMLLRGRTEYTDWRNKVFKRDNYTCQCCGKLGGNLNAHHIENFSSHPELRYDISNGVTLCFDCHSTKSKYGFHRLYGQFNNTKDQLEKYIKMRQRGDI